MEQSLAQTLVIARRFNGPPDSGNGGYVCGRLAAYVSGGASVRLFSPPPLEREMRVALADGTASLLDADRLVAQARPCVLDIGVPEAPTWDEAEAASPSFAGFVRHQLPTCFVCGPKRMRGDGMRIFPGKTADDEVLAAPWIPDMSLASSDGRIAAEFLWAALDCAGAFAILPPEGTPIVLGEMCARIDGAVTAGDRCVIAAWPLGVDRRKRLAGTAVFSAAGTLIAAARATWIEIPAPA